jgi:hypothetical protein
MIGLLLSILDLSEDVNLKPFIDSSFRNQFPSLIQNFTKLIAFPLTSLAINLLRNDLI